MLISEKQSPYKHLFLFIKKGKQEHIDLCIKKKKRQNIAKKNMVETTNLFQSSFTQ